MSAVIGSYPCATCGRTIQSGKWCMCADDGKETVRRIFSKPDDGTLKPRVSGWTKDWPASSGWWWLRSNLWPRSQRSRAIECHRPSCTWLQVDVNGLQILDFSGVMPGEHWLFHPMEQPPEPPNAPKKETT